VQFSFKGRFDKKWTRTFSPYYGRENDILIMGEIHFEEFGIPLTGRIIETPGHSPDHLSVLFDDGNCLAGDAAAKSLQWAGAKHCVISVDDLDQYYASWQKLISGGVQHVFPSHEKPFAHEVLQRNLGKDKREGYGSVHEAARAEPLNNKEYMRKTPLD
jgi:glyoxylase-like metal-dependent hydrolase (beta-lactamase superfamily II)